VIGADLMPDQMTLALFLAGPISYGDSLTINGLQALDGTSITVPISVPITYTGMESFDIGAGSQRGLGVTSNGRDYAVKAARNGTAGTQDEINFLGAPSSWPWTGWQTTVLPSASNGWTQAGVMVRENLTAGSPNTCVAVIVTNGTWRLSFSFRDVQDGPTLPWPGSTEISVAAGTQFELVRDRDLFTAYALDANGNWAQVAAVNRAYNSAVYWGLATAGEGAQTGSLAFVRYQDLLISIGDPDRLLHITRDGQKLTLIWSGLDLESSDDIDGPWVPVIGATSPFTLMMTQPVKLFRLRLNIN
jgi:hypothetical protein